MVLQAVTVDREQVRRDAEEDIRKALRHLVAQDRFEAPLAVDAALALDSLLAELEQAEELLQNARDDRDSHQHAELEVRNALEQAERREEGLRSVIATSVERVEHLGRERDEAEDARSAWMIRATKFEDHLAKVPALVEAAKMVTAEHWFQIRSEGSAYALIQALAVYEQSQGKP